MCERERAQLRRTFRSERFGKKQAFLFLWRVEIICAFNLLRRAGCGAFRERQSLEMMIYNHEVAQQRMRRNVFVQSWTWSQCLQEPITVIISGSSPLSRSDGASWVDAGGGARCPRVCLFPLSCTGEMWLNLIFYRCQTQPEFSDTARVLGVWKCYVTLQTRVLAAARRWPVNEWPSQWMTAPYLKGSWPKN